MNATLTRFSLFIVFTVLLPASVHGQTCNLTVNAGNDIGICAPAILQLSGSTSAPTPDIRSISWSPIFGLSSPTTLSPTASVSSTITYRLTINAFSDSNLVYNGNFDSSMSGFTTSYPLGTGGSFGLLSDPRTYAIATNPNSTHTNFANFGDHTTGTGNMLVVNGDTVANTPVFCQTFPVQPNTDYGFSVWAASCVSGAPAVLEFTINGLPSASTFTLPSTTGVWQQYSQVWNSGTSTSVTLCLYDRNLLNSGNDFAIDDITFREICTATDSMTITLGAIGTLELGPDTTLCAGQSIALDATVANATQYSWNTGDTLAQLQVNASGLYRATASVGGVCPVTDSIRVTVRDYPVFDLGEDTAFCAGDSIRLNATAAQATAYLWQDGNPSAIRVASVAGRYSVIVSNAHCRSYDTVDVSEVLLPFFSLGNDTSLCMPDTILLQAPYYPGMDYQWQDGSSGLSYLIRAPGIYWLEVEEAGCTAREYITVSSGDCGSVFIPNVFTPNGDGRNDTWGVFQTSAVTFDVKIFNRWGELLYVSDDPFFAWDGSYDNRACTQGVYFYVISGSYPSGENFDYHGSVTIIK